MHDDVGRLDGHLWREVDEGVEEELLVREDMAVFGVVPHSAHEDEGCVLHAVEDVAAGMLRPEDDCAVQMALELVELEEFLMVAVEDVLEDGMVEGEVLDVAEGGHRIPYFASPVANWALNFSTADRSLETTSSES